MVTHSIDTFSEFQFHKVQLKGCEPVKITLPAPQFQFHKVQLKVTAGAGLASSLLFQFHKVQLKDPRNRLVTAATIFQFHKVQLKDTPELRAAAPCRPISIP